MRVSEASLDIWSEFTEALPFTCFFQTPYWAIAHQKTYQNMTAKAKMFNDNILVPIIETKYIGLKSHYSMLNGYGGILSDHIVDPETEKQIYDYLKKNVVSSTICPYPLNPVVISGYERFDTFTHIIRVDKPEAMYSKLSHSCRKNISRAQRENLKLTFGKLDDVETYYKIYKSAVSKRGNKEILTPERLIYNLLKYSNGRAKLLFVEKDGIKIAGVIMLYGEGESFQWHASSLYEYENLRPTNFWEWEVLKYAYDNGYSIHNFGSSEGLEGVRAFKESFSPERSNYSYYVYRNPILKSLTR